MPGTQRYEGRGPCKRLTPLGTLSRGRCSIRVARDPRSYESGAPWLVGGANSRPWQVHELRPLLKEHGRHVVPRELAQWFHGRPRELL